MAKNARDRLIPLDNLFVHKTLLIISNNLFEHFKIKTIILDIVRKLSNIIFCVYGLMPVVLSVFQDSLSIFSILLEIAFNFLIYQIPRQMYTLLLL